MELPESILVAAFDPQTRCYTVLGKIKATFATEAAAIAAGCIVAKPPRVPLGIVAGVVNELSPTERVAARISRRPLVISRIPGTVRLPRAASHREPDAPHPRNRRR